MDRLLAEARRALEQLEEASHQPRPTAPPVPPPRRRQPPAYGDYEGPRAAVPAPTAPAGDLRGVLGSREAVRRALILSEIIGTPKGLRPPDRA